MRSLSRSHPILLGVGAGATPFCSARVGAGAGATRKLSGSASLIASIIKIMRLKFRDQVVIEVYKNYPPPSLQKPWIRHCPFLYCSPFRRFGRPRAFQAVWNSSYLLILETIFVTYRHATETSLTDTFLLQLYHYERWMTRNFFSI